MQTDEATCGQEMAQSAEIPALLSELWAHVAGNMIAHAKWVGTDTPEASAEHDALTHLASEYRCIAAAAERAAAIMKSMHDLPPPRHDPTQLDRKEQAHYLRHKVELQLRLADLLVSHADESRSAIAELEAGVEE